MQNYGLDWNFVIGIVSHTSCVKYCLSLRSSSNRADNSYTFYITFFEVCSIEQKTFSRNLVQENKLLFKLSWFC